ncbi:MAG: thiamine pyrophosphate-dependent enzyme, partial [Pseudomonadota bacterium]
HTAVREGMDCIVIVANDRAYGAEHVQFAFRGMDPTQSHLNWPDFASIATAMGGQGYKVDSEAALAKAIDGIKGRKGAILIDLYLDPADMPPPRI